MRETKTGFGAKMAGGAGYQAEGGLQPEDDDTEGEDEEVDEGIDQDDDEEEESDHNFWEWFYAVSDIF